MAERFGGAVPVIRDIAKTLSNISAKNKHWMNRADHIIRMWEGLSKKQSELLGPLMGQARIAEFDPDKDTPTKPEHHQVLAQWRQLQHLDKTAKVKAVNVYRAVRKHFEDDLLESEAYLQQLKTQAKATNDRTLDSLLKTLQSSRKRTKGPYFPLRRRGDHYVVAMSPAMRQLHERRAAAKDGAGLSATDEKLYWQMRKDPKHYINQGVEGEWGAKRLARKFQQSGMSTQVNKGRFRSEVMRASLGKDMESFDQMLAEIKLDDKAKEKLRDAYEDLLIESLPENHPLKSQLAAEGIAGWDNDMRRVFAKTSQSRAFALSRLLHQRTLQEQLAQLETASRAFGPNADLARTLHNELGQHDGIQLYVDAGVLPGVLVHQPDAGADHHRALAGGTQQRQLERHAAGTGQGIGAGGQAHQVVCGQGVARGAGYEQGGWTHRGREAAPAGYAGLGQAPVHHYPGPGPGGRRP